MTPHHRQRNHRLTCEYPECTFQPVLDPTPRRPGNVVCVEVFMSGIPRCTCKVPDRWPEGMALRWIGSGGSPYVFEHCRPGSESCCPEKNVNQGS